MKKYKNTYPMYMNLEGLNTKSINGYEPYNFKPNYNSSIEQMYLPKGTLPLKEKSYGQSDSEYMKDMYPVTCKRIQAYIDEVCDQLEYDGSMMFDEFPDKEEVERMTDQIYVLILKDESIVKCDKGISASEETTDNESIDIQQVGDNWLRDIVKLMFLNELFGRRRYYNRYDKGFDFFEEPYAYNFYQPYQFYMNQKYPFYYGYYFD